MRLLLIDTCGAEGTIALADTASSPVVAMAEALLGRSASERLVPAIKSLLAAQGWSLRELHAIVVVHGPGSFTGVRIGLSAAKGLSEASGIPLIAVSRLAVLADLARGLHAGATVQVAMDAGRGEFYFGRFGAEGGPVESLVTREELAAEVGGDLLVVCEARLVEAVDGMEVRVVREPRAEDAVAIAAARVEAGTFDDAALVDANYLRRTDAQLFARAATG
jgi:tRNA threonylcarbamoyladenosine biosynthesis protein TsaB